VEVVVARDGRLVARAVTLDPPRLDRVKLTAQEGATPAARAAFQAWMGRPHAGWERAKNA
jgi:hypothetical protein